MSHARNFQLDFIAAVFAKSHSNAATYPAQTSVDCGAARAIFFQSIVKKQAIGGIGFSEFRSGVSGQAEKYRVGYDALAGH